MKQKLFKSIGVVMIIAIMLSLPVLAMARGASDYPVACPRCGTSTGSYSQVYGNLYYHITRCAGCGTSYTQRHYDPDQDDECNKCGHGCLLVLR